MTLEMCRQAGYSTFAARLVSSFLKLSGLLCLSAATLSATESVQQTSRYGSAAAPLTIGDDFPVEVPFLKFDSSLGTLTGVTITLTSTFSLQSSVYNIGSAAVFQGAVAQASVTLTDLTGAPLQAALGTLPFSGSIGAGDFSNPAVVSGPVTQNTITTSLFISQADLSLYERTGSGDANSMLRLEADATPGTDGMTETVFFGANASVYGTVVIDYQYQPMASPVPEPSWGGFGAVALCGIALGRRFWMALVRRS